MHKPPILLRRSGSSIPDADGMRSSIRRGSGNANHNWDSNSPQIPSPLSSDAYFSARPTSSGGSVLPPAAPGSGGQINPENAIPIADEDPGDINMAASQHKRKQSGIPLDAAKIYNRASIKTKKISLGDIADEEEGLEREGSDRSLEGSGIAMSRSFSMSDMQARIRSMSSNEEDSTQGSNNGMPEFSDIFPDVASGRCSQLKSLLGSRGVASVAILLLGLIYVTTHHHNSHSNPSTVNPATSTGGTMGPEVTTPKTPDSKQVTYGEFHEEIVGAPMEHHVNEYNKIRFFDSPSKMKPLISKGPILYNEKLGGLHLFENVCLTTNIDSLRYEEPDSALRGLIYFTDDEEMGKNSKRCVPCSNHEQLGGDWDGEGTSSKDAHEVGHKCGMNSLHAMFASSVGDWSDCIMSDENTELMTKWGQTQSPVNVSTIHFFQEPTFLLQFNAMDMEKSLFDMLLTYLPHWDKFLSGGDGDDDDDDDDEGFPFDSVISHSLQGCLSHSHNWFCEVLHQMYAFGEAKEIPWESDDNTLYCYRELFYNEVGYQRNMEHEGLVTKEIFGEFREMLFRKFGLPRRRTVEDRLAELEAERTQAKKTAGSKGNGTVEDDPLVDDTKIIFYDNKLSEQRVWNEMESLISKARELEKFQNIKFVTVNQNFDEMSVAHQARMFNEADAIIMAHGPHMANAIFAVDGASFVEVGCTVNSLIGNPKFMELMDGKYRAVERCNEDDTDICVKCKGDGENASFSMSPDAFEKLIDDVVASLER